MRIPLLFSELLLLYEESDDMYEYIKECAEKTKQVAQEINFKKSKFQEVKNLEKDLVIKKDIFYNSIRTSSMSINKKHNFKNVTLKTEEYCIVCSKAINENAMKCTNCNFCVHTNCSSNTFKNCKNIENISPSTSVDHNNRILISRIDKIHSSSNIVKKVLPTNLLVFNEGVLLVSSHTSTAIEYIKFFSNMTKQFCHLSKSDLNGNASTLSFTITSPRFQTLRYELKFEESTDSQLYFFF